MSLRKRGGIELESTEGGLHGFAKLEAVTSDCAEACEGAQVINHSLAGAAPFGMELFMQALKIDKGGGDYYWLGYRLNFPGS